MSARLVQSVITLVAAAALIAADPPQSQSNFAFLPAKVGDSVTYRYEATESGSHSSGTTREAITLTRASSDDVAIDMLPNAARTAPTTAMIMEDGTLQAITPQETPARIASPSPSPSAKGRARVPRGSQPSFQPVLIPTAIPEARARFPQALSEVLSLLVTAGAPGEFPRTWIFTPSTLSGPLTLSLSRSVDGERTTFVADGSALANSVHVEVIVRPDGFVGARGTTKIVVSNVDQTQLLTTSWTLSR